MSAVISSFPKRRQFGFHTNQNEHYQRLAFAESAVAGDPSPDRPMEPWLDTITESKANVYFPELISRDVYDFEDPTGIYLINRTQDFVEDGRPDQAGPYVDVISYISENISVSPNSSGRYVGLVGGSLFDTVPPNTSPELVAEFRRVVLYTSTNFPGDTSYASTSTTEKDYHFAGLNLDGTFTPSSSATSQTLYISGPKYYLKIYTNTQVVSDWLTDTQNAGWVVSTVTTFPTSADIGNPYVNGTIDVTTRTPTGGDWIYWDSEGFAIGVEKYWVALEHSYRSSNQPMVDRHDSVETLSSGDSVLDYGFSGNRIIVLLKSGDLRIHYYSSSTNGFSQATIDTGVFCFGSISSSEIEYYKWSFSSISKEVKSLSSYT